MMFYTNWIMAITAICASLIGFGGMAAILKNSQKYVNLNFIIQVYFIQLKFFMIWKNIIDYCF